LAWRDAIGSYAYIQIDIAAADAFDMRHLW